MYGIKNAKKRYLDGMKGGEISVEWFLGEVSKLFPYSIANVMTMEYQAGNKLTKVNGADAWKKFYHADIIPGAKPLQIYAPSTNKTERGFVLTNVYDAASTTRRQFKERVPIGAENPINFASKIFEAHYGYSVKTADMSSPFVRKDDRKILYLSTNLSERVMLCIILQQYTLLTVWKLIKAGKRANMSADKTRAEGMAVGYMLAKWLQADTPNLNAKAKKLLMYDGDFFENLKDVQKIFKETRKAISSYLKEQERASKKHF